MILKVYSAEELSKMSGVSEEIIRQAFESGDLTTISFSKKKIKKVTTDEEFNRWLRNKLYKRNKKKLLEILAQIEFEKSFNKSLNNNKG